MKPEEAVKAYHGALQKLGIRPQRSLADDLQQTETASSYSGDDFRRPASRGRRPASRRRRPAGTPDFGKMTPGREGPVESRPLEADRRLDPFSRRGVAVYPCASLSRMRASRPRSDAPRRACTDRYLSGRRASDGAFHAEHGNEASKGLAMRLYSLVQFVLMLVGFAVGSFAWMSVNADSIRIDRIGGSAD